MSVRIPVLTPGSDRSAAVAVRSAAATVTVGGHVVQSRSGSGYSIPTAFARASVPVVSVANPVLVSRPAVYSSPVIVPRPAIHVVTPSTSSASGNCSMMTISVLMIITGLALTILGIALQTILAVAVGIPLGGIGGILLMQDLKSSKNDKPVNPETPQADANAQSKEQKGELKAEGKNDPLHTGDDPSKLAQTPSDLPPPYSDAKKD